MLNNINDLLLVAGKQEGGYEPYYEVLEYIETDGTQYYKTGEILSSTSKVECRASVLGAATQAGSAYIFGAYGANKNFGINRASSGSGFCVWASNSTNFTTPVLSLDTFYDISLSSSGLYIDGVQAKTGNTPFVPSGTFTGGSEAYISWANGTSQTVAKIKLACLKIYQSGVLTKDYIPVLDSKMQPCLYDRVSKTFLYHTNSEGSTSPSFKRWNKYDVDYIQNDANSYIKTGVNDGEETLSYEVDFTYFSGSSYQYVLGAYAGDSYKNTVLYINSSGSIGAWVNKGYSSEAMLPNIVEANARIKCYADTTKSIINENPSTTFAEGVARTGAEIYVFRRNGYNATPAQTTSNAIIGLHSLKINIGNVIVRDFKPTVWHNSDTTAVACMYDEVYNKMYTNAGTGSFKAYVTSSTTAYTLNDGVQNDDYYLAENGTKTVSSDHTSCYTNAIPVKQGDIVEWTVTAEAVAANKRIHGYTTNADIEVGTTGSWVEMLAKIVFSTTSDTTQVARFVVPSGVNYIRLSHANVRESACKITITTTYEVGKSVSGTPSGSVSGVSNCFDTGLYGTQDTIVKYIGIAYDSDSTSGQLFGSYDGTQTTSKNLTINSTGSSGNTAPVRFDGKVISTPIRIALNKTVSIVNSKYGLWVNDNLHGSWGSVNDFTTLTTMLILKCNNSTNVRNNGCGYCMILEKDVPVAEYIPVKNGSTIGLYDRVSKTINTGEGTINFNALD